MAGGYRDELRALRARKEALEAEVEGLRGQEEKLKKKERRLREQKKQIALLEAKVGALTEELEEERDDNDEEPVEDGAAEETEGDDSTDADDEELDARVARQWRLLNSSGAAAPRQLSAPTSARVVTAVGLVAVGLFVFHASSTGDERDGAVARPTPPIAPRLKRNGHRACSLTSVPPGAAVYGDWFADMTNNGARDLDPSQHSRRFHLGTTPVDLAQVINYEVEVELAGYMKTTVTIPEIQGHDLDAPCNLTVVLAETTAPP